MRKGDHSGRSRVDGGGAQPSRPISQPLHQR